MCQKSPNTGRTSSSSPSSSSSSTSSPSSMSAIVAKVTLLLVIAYFTQDVAGGYNDRPSINKKKISSCISYGHSCWGAHGKRNDPAVKNADIKEETSATNDVPNDTRWFISRLSAPAYKLSKNFDLQKELELQNSLRDGGEIDETMPLKRNIQDEEDYQDLPPVLEILYPEDFRSKSLNDKLRFLNYLKAQKLN